MSAEPITDEHIHIASDQVLCGRVRNKHHDQTVHGQLILEATARLETNGQVRVRSKEIKDVYERVAVGWI